MGLQRVAHPVRVDAGVAVAIALSEPGPLRASTPFTTAPISSSPAPQQASRSGLARRRGTSGARGRARC